ncbi:MAG: hypothetical protein L0211_05495 [Planctomycetaceae bacterium]|nr:hypothetical protein [Planctomycetaceae bacterium]
MAGTWGNWQGSWERPMSGEEDLAEVLEEEDAAAIARWLAARDFWLVDDGLENDEGGTAALVLDVEGSPVVVVFTSEKHVSAYAQEKPEMFDDPQNIPGFVVEGRNVILNLPEGGGVLIDPATDDEQYLPPELVTKIRAEMVD